MAKNKEETEEEIEEDVELEESHIVEEKENTHTEKEKPKRKKHVIRRKVKKSRENPINTAIRLTVESGSVIFGSRSAIKGKESGKTKLFIIAQNTPHQILDSLRNANTGGIPVYTFPGSSLELGSVCGKPYPVSVISVFNFGNSDIESLISKKR